jgi:hypothetical protein
MHDGALYAVRAPGCTFLFHNGRLTQLKYFVVLCRSEYLLKRIIGVQNSDQFAYDMCPNYKCPGVFGKQLQVKDRRARQGERCRLCGANRFIKKNLLLTAARRCMLHCYICHVQTCSTMLGLQLSLSQNPGVCSGYILSLADIIRHLFMNPLFARFAGTRTQAMLDSPWYHEVDRSVHGLLSALRDDGSTAGSDAVEGEGRERPGDVGIQSSQRYDAEVERNGEDGSHSGDSTGVDAEGELQEVQDPDPSDEVMTGAGDHLALLWAIFHDGVQMYDKTQATTMVFSIKCLCLPGWLVHTLAASFNIAFVGGNKEPSILKGFLGEILKMFKAYEPRPSLDGALNVARLLLGCNRYMLFISWDWVESHEVKGAT